MAKRIAVLSKKLNWRVFFPRRPYGIYEAVQNVRGTSRDLIDQRGMVADRASLIEHLQDAGYYRLSGYWHIFKQPDDMFRGGTTFAKVWDLYTFDRQFRLVVFDAIERVEVYFRTQLAYELARTTGPFGFNDRNNLPNLGEERYGRFIRKCKEAFNRSREPFAIHFKDKYGDERELPPYWMLVNLMDFGMTLTLYKGASNGIRKRIAQKEHCIKARRIKSALRFK